MDSRNGIQFDVSEAPLVVVKYPRDASVEGLKTAFELYCEWSERYGRVGYVFDFRDFNPLTVSPLVRRTFADLYDLNRHVLEPATVSEALVHSSKLVSGLSTAINWLTSRPHPQRQFTNYYEAMRWVHSTLVQDGATSGT
ncbi:MAG: hypothetical protein AAF654_07590 [Myxococcota bacterium]